MDVAQPTPQEAPLNGNKEGRGQFSLTRFPTNSLYTPMNNTPLHSIPSVCRPWGEGLLSSGVVNMSVGNRVGVCLTRSTIWLLLLSLFPVRGSSK